MGLGPGTGAWDLGQVLEEEWDSNSKNREGRAQGEGKHDHTVMSEAPQGIRARGWAMELAQIRQQNASADLC